MPTAAYGFMRRGRTEAAFVIACIDIAVSSVLGTILAGEASAFLFYIMVPLVLAALHPTRSTFVRWSWVTVLAIVYLAFEVFWPSSARVADWPTTVIHFLHVLNILIVSAAMVVVAVLSAITIARAERNLQEALHRTEELALHDGLTGLLNRRAMQRVLQRETARSRRTHRPYAVLMADIDHFKSINDRFGHAVGDDVLRTVASHLRDGLRGQDVVSRWGGEEFLAILPETDLAGGEHVAEKLRAEIERHLMAFQGHELDVTMTFGLAGSDSEGPFEAVVEAADQAMYQGKRAGRNRVVASNPSLATA